ncbi:hypothetical protein [Aquabacter spiritensis]|uniref:Uncharacterized protein n=1 Tax=Aquabacter spiritensis TaxID=933073 RepID=A0A4R3LQ78_9HYPH|nr:hypothetical protein [Aquabacter spiritensis]TCT02714.1 hypothetical protein EDC64_112153 [Aquabacter spiritensis]
MSIALRDGVRHLETTARVSLLVLALASGVYTYLGVRELLEASPAAVFFAAIIYSAAVSVAIYAFWAFLMRFLPQVVDATSRMLLLGAMALGCVMIVAMSSWLNASALAGAAALERHLGASLAQAEDEFQRAYGNALATQGLAPDIQLAATRFAELAQAERSGSLTGTSGSGTVVQLLGQMSNQLAALGKEVAASGGRIADLNEEGARHLAAMRERIAASGPVAARAEDFGNASTALAGVMTALQQASIAPAVKRIAADLGENFIAPAADGRTAEIAGRQTEVVGRVQTAVAAQARALAKAADAVIDRPPVVASRYEQISPAEAVLRYANDFVPSWAGAISIDLLPGVLVLILCVVHAAIRREGAPLPRAGEMTAAELVSALRMAHEVGSAHAALRAPPAPAAPASDLPDVPGPRLPEVDPAAMPGTNTARATGSDVAPDGSAALPSRVRADAEPEANVTALRPALRD